MVALPPPLPSVQNSKCTTLAIILCTGSYFHLSDSLDPPTARTDYHCKLSPDHDEIIISSDHEPINMRHILEVKTVSTEPTSPGQCRFYRSYIYTSVFVLETMTMHYSLNATIDVIL